MSKSIVATKDKPHLMIYLNSIILSLVTSFLLIICFALLIKWLEWGDSVIAPVNIAIKIVSIGVGVFFATKDGQHGIKRGAIVGLCYIIFSYTIFSILLGSFTFSIKLLWDILLGIFSGAILGIFIVNIKR